VSQLSTDFGAYALCLGHVVVALGAEAVHVDHGQLRVGVRGEELADLGGREVGNARVQANEGGEEGDGGGGEVHDVVGECARLHERLQWCRGLDGFRVGPGRLLGFGVDGDRVRGVEEVSSAAANEGMAVGVEGAHKVSYFVGLYVGHEAVEAFWVEVVGVDEALPLACWDSEGTHARHNVTDGIPLVEQVAQSLVLGMQARVPIDLGEVKLEGAALLADGDIHVVRAVQDLVLEGAVCVLGADVVELVDDSADQGRLVGQDLPDQVLVRQVALAEVQVGDVARLREARRQLVVAGRLRRGDDGGRDLGISEAVVVELQLVRDDADGALLLELLQLRAPRIPICLVFRLSISRSRMGGASYRLGRSLGAAAGTFRPFARAPRPGRSARA